MPSQGMPPQGMAPQPYGQPPGAMPGMVPHTAPAGAPQGGFDPALGSVVATFTGRYDWTDPALTGGAFLILLCLVGAGYTLVDIIGGTEAIQSLTAFPIGIGIGAFLVWLCVRKARQKLVMHDAGLKWTIGGKDRVITWSEITGAREIRILAPNGLQKGYKLVLCLRDGKSVTFGNYIRDVQSIRGYVANYVQLGH
jgi:hypothetical protein